MKPNDFKLRAGELLKQLDEIQTGGESDSLDDVLHLYLGLQELLIDFIHLVYAFDHNLPLNKLIADLPNIKFGSQYLGNSSHNEEKFNNIRFYINFFIQYIEDYYE